MNTQQTTLADFTAANGIRMTVERTDRNPHMDGSEKMDNWKCKLHRGASRMTVHFSKGIGHNGAEPTLEEVLDCLASDAAGVENSPTFEEFCGEYGYDTDSRKAEHTFKACLRETRSLKAFLGEHQYAVLLWSTERL